MRYPTMAMVVYFFFAVCNGKDSLFILNQVRTLFVHGHLRSLSHSLALFSRLICFFGDILLHYVEYLPKPGADAVRAWPFVQLSLICWYLRWLCCLGVAQPTSVVEALLLGAAKGLHSPGPFVTGVEVLRAHCELLRFCSLWRSIRWLCCQAADLLSSYCHCVA